MFLSVGHNFDGLSKFALLSWGWFAIFHFVSISSPLKIATLNYNRAKSTIRRAPEVIIRLFVLC
jgi:hypothetical protein